MSNDKKNSAPGKTVKAKKTSIGGQALIEGVMMRGPQTTAMAVRHTSGRIVLEQWENSKSGKALPAWRRVPLLRGVFNMVESMISGYKCLMRSAELCGLDAEEEAAEEARRAQKAAKKAAKRGELQPPVSPQPSVEAADSAAAPPSADEAKPEAVDQNTDTKTEPRGAEQVLFSAAMVFSVILGVGLALVLFMWLPTFLYNHILKALIPALATGYRWIQSVFEGVMRLALFLAYVLLVSLMKDIRRVFMYHGAEHKSIFCYEHGLELTVDNVRKQSRFHPRCGTSFLVLSLLVGILVSMCIPIYDNTLLRVSVKLLVLPLIVGIGYELIKLAGRRDNAFTRAVSKPGMWMQRITTREPDDSMIECAIASLKAVIPDDPDADNW